MARATDHEDGPNVWPCPQEAGKGFDFGQRAEPPGTHVVNLGPPILEQDEQMSLWRGYGANQFYPIASSRGEQPRKTADFKPPDAEQQRPALALAEQSQGKYFPFFPTG